MKQNRKRMEWVRRLTAIFLCLLLCMSNVPFSFGRLHTAHADEKRCPECGEYKDADFCEKCGKCEDCVEICDHCGEECLNCHQDEFDAEGESEADPCGECMRCKVGVDYCGHCGRCEECVELCDRCPEGLCLECHAELEAVDEYLPCPDCGKCKADGTPYCPECDTCEDCAELCSYCGLCENCWEQSHCEFCDACLEYAGWCPDGGMHCVDCCETCEGCGTCFLTDETEKCDICGYCMDCCEDQGCPECGLCAQDDTYEDHLCSECGACLTENDACETCGLCKECCLEQLLQLGYTGDDRCFLEITDEDFCADCGTCFLEAEICQTCLDADEYRCKECCALLSHEKGCDCEEPVCVNSEEFAVHMENDHSEYVDAHQATPKNTWNMDLNSHWHDCRYCNEETHRSGQEAHRFDENGRCTVCGYLSTDKIVIARQPYDVQTTATYNGWCQSSSLPAERPGDRLVTFSVIAYGKNGVNGLLYQWHQVIAYGSTDKDITLEETTNPYTSYATGTRSPVLRVGIESNVCYQNNNYYCVITDEEGNEVKTRNAKLNADHRYEVFDPDTCRSTEKGHTLHCVCRQCEVLSGFVPHTFGNWEWRTDEDGVQTGKVRTCLVCGYEDVVPVHEHNFDYGLLYEVGYENANIIKENDKTNEYEYEFTYDGKTIRAAFNRGSHYIDCCVPGCTFSKKEKHNWGRYKIINNATETKHGTVYRTCVDCGMDETWIRTYYDWHTHPVNVEDGTADENFAPEDTIVCVEPLPVDGKRVTGGVAQINYTRTAGVMKRHNQATISLTEVIPGKLYSFRVPASGENGTSTVNGRVYTNYDEYGAEQIDVTFTYEDCIEHVTELTGQVEPDCTKDGYTGDEICTYCGHVVTKGTYLAPKGHGEPVLASENIYETDNQGKPLTDKRGNYQYIVHAPETVNCDDSGRGCYTGDYICPDCGEVLEYGKYTSKKHDFIPFEELSAADQERYGNLYRMKPYQAPVGEQAGYSGDSICFNCLDEPTVKYGHSIWNKSITKLDIQVKKLPKIGEYITTDDIVVPEQVEIVDVLWYNWLLDEEYEPGLLLNSMYDPSQMELCLTVKPKEGFWFKDYEKADTAEGSVAAYVNGKKAKLNGFITSSQEYRSGCLTIDTKELGFTGGKLTGKVRSIGNEEEEINLTLVHKDYPDQGYELTVTGNEADYCFEGISDGTWVLTVQKKYHVLYEKELVFDGKPVELDVTLQAESGVWKQDANGWWYKNPDGSYPKSQWKKIDGNWYYFDNRGYRVTGWQDIGDKRYYFDEEGVMQTGWIQEGEDYYYLKADGSMARDEWVDGGKYYVDEDGKWVKGKTKERGLWKRDAKGYWYQNADGTYPKNQWAKIDGNWYRFDKAGYMLTGWYKEGSVYYYLKKNGAMAKDEWVEDGKYYLDANGKWVKGKILAVGKWVKDDTGWKYQNADETFVAGAWKKIGGKWYHFNEQGYMQTGWYREGIYYYYLKADGSMAVNEWVDGERYYVDSNGHWVKDAVKEEV